MFDTGGRQDRLFDALFRRGIDDRGVRNPDQGLYNYHVRTAAQAIVPGPGISVLILVVTLRMGRNVTTGRWQQVTGENLHRCEEHQKDRRNAERLRPETHL